MANNRARYIETLRRGQAYNAAEHWRRAFHMFHAALEIVPQAPEAYAGLGEACFGLRLLDRALESYKLAARYSRGDLTYLEKVADLQERLGQLSEAAKTYMAAGELQLRQRQLEQAVFNWERAVRLEPSLLGAHRRLAMVHQRQGNVRGAVRECLAIARILQDRGKPEQALKMCHTALRLDPGNEDALLAIRLVQEGAAAVGEDEAAPGELKRTERAAAAVVSKAMPVGTDKQPATTAPAPSAEVKAEPVALTEDEREQQEMAQTVRQIATVFEEERRHWQQTQQPQTPADPVAVATQRAQDELAEEIFRDEEGEADLYGVGPKGLSKLERDALIGQGMDFQSRGDIANAIACYEKAVGGGLRLPAAFFTLGLLYVQAGKQRHARAAFLKAGQDRTYREPAKLALANGEGERV